MLMVVDVRIRAGCSSKGTTVEADGDGFAGEACPEADRGDFEWVFEGPGVLGVSSAWGVDMSGVGMSAEVCLVRGGVAQGERVDVPLGTIPLIMPLTLTGL